MNKVQQYINSHGLPFRGDCIVCGHKNTLSATIVDGWVLYNCYSASCKIKGKYKHEFSIESIRATNNSSIGNELSSGLRASNSDNVYNGLNTKQEYIIPEYFRSPLQDKFCYNFLKYWNLVDIYAEGRIGCWYDPKQNRCAFEVRDHERVLKGASGRILRNVDSPRWYIYDRINGCPGIINSRDNIYDRAILVEDFISASTSSNMCSSIALLGTNIPIETIGYLTKYKQLWIALDPDARLKALKLQHQLSPFVNTKILDINKDLKYYSKSELEEIRNKINN